MTAPIPNDSSRWRGQGVLNANGVKWRLRGLVAMGHSPARIAEGMGVSLNAVKPLIAGHDHGISAELRDRAVSLYEQWWDKTPPRTTREERITASKTLQRAARENWPTPMALDEADPDYDPGHVPGRPAARQSLQRHTEIVRAGMDHPDYEPVAVWMPATGRGVARDPQRDAERELEAG